jgi:DNA-binding XRE family transcriptional regulator
MNGLRFPARCRTKFQQWRKRYGVSVPAAAQLFDVTEKTVRNWDKREAPTLALRMCDIFQRDLSGLHPSWSGISLRPDGKLYFATMVGARSGPVGLTADHIRNYPSAINRLHQLEADISTRAQELVRQLHHLGHRIDVAKVVQALEGKQPGMLAKP